uniref:Peptidase A1 domain-containing protein n=1 Tax=Heterorhabditis bacteriophora TaxID=37862 RepID=A0A1I7X2V5_HETBA
MWENKTVYISGIDAQRKKANKTANWDTPTPKKVKEDEENTMQEYKSGDTEEPLLGCMSIPVAKYAGGSDDECIVHPECSTNTALFFIDMDLITACDGLALVVTTDDIHGISYVPKLTTVIGFVSAIVNKPYMLINKDMIAPSGQQVGLAIHIGDNSTDMPSQKS